MISTVFGRVQVPRRRFRCQSCQRRWCPANTLFAALKGGTISQPLQDAAIQAGCSWPYRVACQQLRNLSGAQISPEEMRLLANAYGNQRAERQQQEAERLCGTAANKGQEPPSAATAEPPLLVGIDGGWVGSREQRGGMEGKVAVVCGHVEDLPMPTCSPTFSWSTRGSPRRPPRQRHRLAQRRYVATFGPAKLIGQQAEAAARMVSEKPTRPVVVIADGANWIKTEQVKHFPRATCILDWAQRFARDQSCDPRGSESQTAQ